MAQAFITLGVLFLVGLAADTLGRRTRIPRVTLLLVLGVIAGPGITGLMPEATSGWYEPLATVALTMVAFLLGGVLTRETLRAHGAAILWVSGGIVVVTVTLVGGGLWLIGVPAEVAVVLGAIATATAPAATQGTLREIGAKGPFADTVRGVVAVDDVWGLIVFALAMVAAQAVSQGAFDPAHLTHALRDVGGAVLLGVLLGVPAAKLTGRIRSGQPTQFEALGLVFLVAGLALWAEVSFLIAGMTAGAIIANFAKHHDYAFHEIEHIEQPFLILFFLLAGAALEIEALWALGVVGGVYVALRLIARLAGGWLGGRLGGLDPVQSRWIGVALLAQAGVAVGMALVAAQALPEHRETILTMAIGTTVVFELMGAALLTVAVRRVGRDS